jgi:hypothetical protein
MLSPMSLAPVDSRMTEHDESLSLDEVRALALERTRFDGWLTTLEERRGTTPAHVFDRVRHDYVARRARIIAQLVAFVPALRARLDALDHAAVALADTMAAHEDERAEAMLRHAVGEFDDPTWEEVRARVELTVERLFGEQVTLEEQRDEVRRLLGDAMRPAESEPAAGVPVVDGDSLDTRATGALAAEAPSGDAAAPDARATDALVTDAPVTDALVTDALITDAPVTDALASDALVTDRLAADHAPAAPEAAEAGRTAHPDAASVAGVPVTGDRAAPPGADTAFDELAFLRSVIDPAAEGQSSGGATAADGAAPTGAAPRTLRCTECGALNLPTEWYCERCGSELASF